VRRVAGDRRLRELEQRWLATRDLDVERELIQARVRAGTLPRSRLLLAAYVGSTAAQQLLGTQGFAEEPNLLTWIRGLGKGRLARHPDQARASATRAVLASLELAIQAYEAAEGADPTMSVLLEDFHALRALLTAALAGGEEPVAVPRRETALALPIRQLLRAARPQGAASLAAMAVDQIAKLLRGEVRHQRKALRRTLSDALLEWTLAG